jgi:hypothetical protein
MPKLALFFTLLTPFFAILHAESSLEEQLRLALMLRDSTKSLQISRKLDPMDPSSKDLLFERLALNSDLEGMKSLWLATKKAPLSEKSIERIAWAVIDHSSRAYHPRIRIEAALAAAMSNDAKGMDILHRLLNDPHETIQQLTLELALHYPDAPIQQKAAALTRSSTPGVKLAAAQLLTAQKASIAQESLEHLLLDDSLSEQDICQVASLLSSLQEEKDDQWFISLVHDQRPSMNILAASFALHYPSVARLKESTALLESPHFHVKKCELQAIGLWQHLLPNQDEHLKVASSLLNPERFSIDLASTAAWVLFLSHDPIAKEQASSWFRTMLSSSIEKNALVACSRLCHTGKRGIELAHKLLKESPHTLCRLNLAIFLLTHRAHTQEAADVLKHTLLTASYLLGETDDGIFSWIGPSAHTHHPAIFRFPESKDLFLRLELIALQSYVGQPIEKQTIEQMLTDRAWGIPAAAAGLFFQEAASSLEEVVIPLLSHDIESVRVQAALIYACSGSQKAASILWEQYQKASREGKESLLFGFGGLPPSSTKELLTPLLFDESPVLRTRAAGALLTSLYK